MNGEDMERRMHWLKLARELGQEDDFRALLDDVRRDAIEEARRGKVGHSASINASEYPPNRPTITGYLMDGRTVDLIEEYASRCANLQPHDVHWPELKVRAVRNDAPARVGVRRSSRLRRELASLGFASLVPPDARAVLLQDTRGAAGSPVGVDRTAGHSQSQGTRKAPHLSPNGGMRWGASLFGPTGREAPVRADTRRHR